MDTRTVTPATQDVLAQEVTPVVQDSTELVEITADSLHRFEPEVQAQILKLADQIDPLQLDKILAYGSIPLLRTYESAGQVLKAAEGTSVDQEVVRQVVELSKQVNKGQDDLNVALQEPNWLQRTLMSIFTSLKEKHTEDTKVKAITCYRILTQLRDKCEVWHSMLQDNWRLIYQSIEDDTRSGVELEQYLVAGLIAMERLEADVGQRKLLADQSGLISDKRDYDNHKKGVDAFKVVLLNLKKSLTAYGISIGQLSAQKSTNENLQIAVSTQKTNSMTLASQQLRNSILETQNRIVMEGQRSITTLNSELMKKVATNTVLTAEESEKVLLSGVYTIEAALEAAKTVVDGCEAIRKAREERAENVAQEMDKLQELVEQISPFIANMRKGANSASTASGAAPAPTSKGLTF